MYRRCAALLVTLLLATTVAAQNAAVTISVDAAADRKPINPLIYGLSFASQAELDDLNSPINRSGGNAKTRYNWQANASNRAQDWYFQSISEGSATAGDDADAFVALSRAAGAEPMLTIPTIGWVAKLGTSRSKLASYSIAKYGAQTDRDWQWFPDAGNGIRLDGTKIVTNDPHDANMPVDSAFQASWVEHLKSRWGSAGSGGVKYYILDNEPSIWFETHRDVHPVGPTMDEIRDKILDYGARIKAADPAAIIVAPEEWGWSGYIFSGYDQQYGAAHNWQSFPDRVAHGGADYLPWLLDQLRQRHAATGTRLLDIFTVHYYPQGGEFSNDTSTTMQLRRNRSTRSLWDPSYVDPTWINDTVKLVPRLRSWVNQYYPGTQTGITEYNWGAESHINGATTQADILGIFGREGLDIATRWTTPASSTPTYKAMKMYRNYDGAKSTFGETSVRATGANPDELSSFAAVRGSDGALTVMLINKVLSGSTPVTVNLANFNAAASVERWQLTSGNAIQRQTDLTVSGSTASLSLPPQSVTLLVVRPSSSTPAATGSVRGGGTICPGAASLLFVDLTGQAPWTLRWSDGLVQNAASSPAQREVRPSTTTSYSLASLSDAAGAGTVSGTAVVTVRASASIVTQPQSTTVKKNGTATLQVTAGGGTPLTYRWYEGVSGNTSKPVGSNSATFRTPKLGTSTSYWVRVSNDCGSVDSATATVSVRLRTARVGG